MSSIRENMDYIFIFYFAYNIHNELNMFASLKIFLMVFPVKSVCQMYFWSFDIKASKYGCWIVLEERVLFLESNSLSFEVCWCKLHYINIELLLRKRNSLFCWFPSIAITFSHIMLMWIFHKQNQIVVLFVHMWSILASHLLYLFMKLYSWICELED